MTMLPDIHKKILRGDAWGEEIRACHPRPSTEVREALYAYARTHCNVQRSRPVRTGVMAGIYATAAAALILVCVWMSLPPVDEPIVISATDVTRAALAAPSLWEDTAPSLVFLPFDEETEDDLLAAETFLAWIEQDIAYTLSLQ